MHCATAHSVNASPVHSTDCSLGVRTRSHSQASADSIGLHCIGDALIMDATYSAHAAPCSTAVQATVDFACTKGPPLCHSSKRCSPRCATPPIIRLPPRHASQYHLYRVGTETAPQDFACSVFQDWIVHLDEWMVLDEAGIHGIVAHVLAETRKIQVLAYSVPPPLPHPLRFLASACQCLLGPSLIILAPTIHLNPQARYRHAMPCHAMPCHAMPCTLGCVAHVYSHALPSFLGRTGRPANVCAHRRCAARVWCALRRLTKARLHPTMQHSTCNARHIACISMYHTAYSIQRAVGTLYVQWARFTCSGDALADLSAPPTFPLHSLCVMIRGIPAASETSRRFCAARISFPR